ncbi:MAG: hypothetical protein R3C44_07655 [Chloroflexota bacterium]
MRTPVEAVDNIQCLQTTVRYWMWTPGVDGQSAEYCQCIDSATGIVVPEQSPACMTP